MLESVVVEHNAEQLSEGYKLAGKDSFGYRRCQR